ncbi:hypothetical protein F4680DRAFT_29945 [Xylaria scruposa]|nr:hypothetical protein F4680DRAFT_29945 [Xylaria scruposa]
MHHRTNYERRLLSLPPLSSGYYINAVFTDSAVKKSIFITHHLCDKAAQYIGWRLSVHSAAGPAPNPFTPLAFWTYESRSCELRPAEILDQPVSVSVPLNFFSSRFLQRAASALRQRIAPTLLLPLLLCSGHTVGRYKFQRPGIIRMGPADLIEIFSSLVLNCFLYMIIGKRRLLKVVLAEFVHFSIGTRPIRSISGSTFTYYFLRRRNCAAVFGLHQPHCSKRLS